MSDATDGGPPEGPPAEAPQTLTTNHAASGGPRGAPQALGGPRVAPQDTHQGGGPPGGPQGGPPGGPQETPQGWGHQGDPQETPQGGGPQRGFQVGPLGGPQVEEASKDNQLYLKAVKELSEAPKMKLGLEDVEKVAAALGNPQQKFNVIHVAGTNGKGSVCTKVAACLMAKGSRVGVFTSPHLCCLRERFAVNGELISENKFVHAMSKVKRAAQEVGVSLTFFEICSLIAYIFFAESSVDWALLEVGLGGRLDATNIVANPKCCVITSIGWDHMNILGNSLEAIATEKAKIIKKNAGVVLGPTAACWPIFLETAAALQCDVWEVKGDPRGDTFDAENSRIADTVVQQVLRLDLPSSRLAAALSSCPPMRGQLLSEQQLRVAARLCSSSSSSSTQLETEDSDLPVPQAVILDVGHNESALERLFQMVGYRFFGASVRIFCCLSNDRSPDILRPALAQFFFPLNNRLKGLYVATADHPRVQETAAIFEQIVSSSNFDADLRRLIEEGIMQLSLWLKDEQHEETQQQQQQQEADIMQHAQQIRPGTLPQLLRKAFAAAAADASVLVVCGSFFMMREVMQTFGLADGPIDPVDMNERMPTPP